MHSLAELAELYNQKFKQNNFNTNPTNLYVPVNHIMSIPGKRIRPLLVLLSCGAFGGNPQKALSAAFAMEIFHNFTLVHDDIMDQSEIRRGIPTVHKLYGLNAGILAGDVMLAYAYQYLMEIETHYIPSVLHLFNKTAIEIFEGQQMDIDFETRDDVSLDEYLKMVEYKTSVLLACSLQIGAIVANAAEADQNHIYKFGLNLGLSFQIKDDLLDAFGESAKVGKKIGGDILMNKKTFLYITAMQNANPDQLSKLKNLQNEQDEWTKIKEVKSLLQETGAYDITVKKSDDLFKLALDSLGKTSLSEASKSELQKMAIMINQRDY